MVAIFNNSFFSLAGQKERLLNVGATINAAFNPFSKDKVQANVSNQSVKKTLEVVANNPYTVAGLATGASLISPVLAKTAAATTLNVAKSLIPSTTKGKVIAAIATPVIAGAIAQQPKEIGKAIIKAPKELANFGGDVANLLVDPSIENLKELVSESPIITSGLAAAGLIAGGSAVISAVQNQRVINAIEGIGGVSPDDTVQALPSSPVQPIAGGGSSSKIPLTPQTQEVGATTRRKRRKSSIKQPNVIQRVTVNLQNKNLKIGKYLNNKRLAL